MGPPTGGEDLMTVVEILAFLGGMGITIERYRGDPIARPKSAITPEVVELIRSHKAELLDELTTEGEVYEFPSRVREPRAANLALETEIVWEEDPSAFD
jgi:hypothetical protein